MLSLSEWLKTEFERPGEKLGRNMWMIQDGDHQLCKQKLSSLIAVLGPMRPDVDNTRAEVSPVPLPLQPSCSGLQVEGNPATGQKTFAGNRKSPAMRPGANSRSVEFWSTGRRSTCLQIIRTCQKEP